VLEPPSLNPKRDLLWGSCQVTKKRRKKKEKRKRNQLKKVAAVDSFLSLPCPGSVTVPLNFQWCLYEHLVLSLSFLYTVPCL